MDDAQFKKWSEDFGKKQAETEKRINLLGADLNLESKLNKFVSGLNEGDGHLCGKYRRDIDISESVFRIVENKTKYVIVDMAIKPEDCRVYGRIYPEYFKDAKVMRKVLEFFGENKIIIGNYESD